MDKIYLVVLFCALLGGTGQVLMKKGMDSFAFTLANLVRNYALIIGIGLYGAAFILYLFSLQFGEVSKLYPIIAFSYLFVPLLSALFLREHLTAAKIIGSLGIIASVWVIAR